jgi:hypothetical protein
MVKVIKFGKIYDVDSSTFVRDRAAGHDPHDGPYPEDRHDGLYQAPDGEFFRWECDSERGDIFPLSRGEAYKWVEEHGTNLLLKQYFGPLPKEIEYHWVAQYDQILKQYSEWVEEHANDLLCHDASDVKEGSRNKTTTALKDAEVSEQVMERSRQRNGVVAGGTLLTSGARQVTASFPPDPFKKLKLAAEKKGVSLSEMVRQGVEIALGGPEVAPE